MNLRVIFRIIGYFLFYLGLTMLLPLAWSVYEGGPDIVPLAASMGLTLIVGLTLRFLFRGPEDEISLKDGFAIVTFCWLSAAIFGAIPYMMVGVFDSLTDAFFESMSGFTTTGATVIDDIESLPRGILLWRSQTQWLGGMGIVVLFVALFPKLGVKGMQLLKAEMPGPVTVKVVPRVAQTAKVLWVIYVGLSAAQMLAMMLAGVDFYNALSHAFTTMPTGGFSPLNDSIAGFQDPVVEVIIMVFMAFAGINFALYYSLVRGKPQDLLRDEEFKFYMGGLILFSLIVSTHLYLNGYGDTWLISARKGFFQVISIITTTGYVTEDFELWTPFGRQLLFLLMFLGGSGGSTGGAIKQVRILTVIKHSFRELYRLIHPNAVLPVRLNKAAVKEPVIASIVGYIFLYLFIFVISAVIISLSGLDMPSSFSAVAATLGNVGPGLGAVGPVETYGFFSPVIKVLLSLLMLLGRLEIYTVAVMLLPEFRRLKRIKLYGAQE